MYIFVLLGLLLPVSQDEISLTPESIKHIMATREVNNMDWAIVNRKDIFKQVENIMIADAKNLKKASGIFCISAGVFSANPGVYKEKYIIVPTDDIGDIVTDIIKKELLRKGFKLMQCTYERSVIVIFKD